MVKIAQLTNKVKASALTQGLLDTVAKETGKHVKFPAGFTVSVVGVGDDEMQSLNSIYRGVDEVTDVLSFPYDVTDNIEEHGEIVICYQQAARQAKSKQVSITKELQWLLIHGILHVLGYDHETAEDAKIMRPLERTILAQL